ncbi:MAG: hypothetical protein WCJ30_04645, partial [Deltaproteobacteria bacterium]
PRLGVRGLISLNQMTKFVGIIGYPVGHSVSPQMQQAAFDYYKLDIEYELWETAPDKLASLVERLRQPKYLGANITVPHKGAMLRLVDELEALASEVGAVNTVVNRDGRLYGFFTTTPVQIARIDKGTGSTSMARSLPQVETPQAWAFSFWGGDFYLYTAPSESDPTRTSNVTRFRPSDGSVDAAYMTNVGFRIVGAGVSTCAPILPPG